MKYRCACAKPRIMMVNTEGVGYTPMKPDLHFKVADRFCERCGRPLCSKCAGDYKVGIRDNKFTTFEYLCPICAEVI